MPTNRNPFNWVKTSPEIIRYLRGKQCSISVKFPLSLKSKNFRLPQPVCIEINGAGRNDIQIP